MLFLHSSIWSVETVFTHGSSVILLEWGSRELFDSASPQRFHFLGDLGQPVGPICEFTQYSTVFGICAITNSVDRVGVDRVNQVHQPGQGLHSLFGAGDELVVGVEIVGSVSPVTELESTLVMEVAPSLPPKSASVFSISRQFHCPFLCQVCYLTNFPSVEAR